MKRPFLGNSFKTLLHISTISSVANINLSCKVFSKSQFRLSSFLIILNCSNFMDITGSCYLYYTYVGNQDKITHLLYLTRVIVYFVNTKLIK